jgi:hypothetical protein
MKKNLKTNLKRLTSGFISSIMMMSFILMPIPNVSVVYAETNEAGVECPTDDDVKNGAIYVAGCDFHKAFATTTMDSDTDYDNSGTVSKFISQYIVGMMGVILINSLNWKRLSKYNVGLYGNDCRQNFGPLVSIPTGMVSGLLYMIGDIQSNIQFQAAAKKAADEYDMELTDLKEFTGKSKERIVEIKEGLSDEETKELKDQATKAIESNSAQEKGYDALMAVLEGQKKALKTKKNMAGASAVGYAIADSVEIANMVAMHTICSFQWGKKATDKGLSAGEFTTAFAALTTAATPPLPTAGVCVPALTAFNSAKGIDVAQEAKDIIAGGAYGGAKALEGAEAVSGFAKFLASIKGAFTGSGAVGVVAELGSSAKDTAREVKELGIRAAMDAKDIGTASTYAAAFTALDKTSDACLVAKAVKDLSTGNFHAEMQQTVSCCGGPGVNSPIFIYAKSLQATTVTNIYAAVKAETKNVIKKKGIKLIIDKAIKFVTGGLGSLYHEIISMVKGQVKQSDIPVTGSYWWQSVPAAPGLFSLKRDIKVLNLFGGGSNGVTFNQAPKLNKQELKELKTLKFYVRNSFESGLRQMTMKGIIKYDMDKPLETLKSIADTEKKIQRIMNEFDKYLDSDLVHMAQDEQVNPKSLAFQKVLKKIKNELFMPAAHAGITGSLIGVAASMAGQKIGGPWGEVLNVGGKIMALHSMLGKFTKRYALNRPVTRALTWTGLGLLSNHTKTVTNKALVQVEENMEVIRTEKERFLKSGTNGSGFAGDRSGMGRGSLRNSKYGTNKISKMNIKACVVANGDSFLPSNCGSITPKKNFQVKGIGISNNINSSPIGFAHSMLTDTAFGAGNDPEYASNMSSADLARMEQANKAMAKVVKKKVALYDEIMATSKDYKKAGGKSLAANIAKLKKVLFKDGVTGSNSNLGNSNTPSGSNNPLASTKPTTTLGTGSVVSKQSPGGVAAPAASAPGFDFDYGDTGGVTTDNTEIGAQKSAKKAQKLGDFVMKHNDISKRKDVSIFKILSNRYILSYPKVLEEENIKK